MSDNSGLEINEVREGLDNNDLIRPQAVDFLEPAKPIEEYEEFNYWQADVNSVPHYQFGIKNVASLIQHKTEQLGKEFPVPGWDKMSAQIKCTVNYDDFQFAIQFLNPTMVDEEVEAGFKPIVTVLLKDNDQKVVQKICFVFPLAQKIIYNRFSPIIAFSYENYVKELKCNKGDSFNMSLFVKNSFLNDVPISDELLLWKVDVSHLNLVDRFNLFDCSEELGFSPFIRKKRGHLQAQLRLYVNGNHVEAEARFFNQHPFSSLTPKMIVSLIHPTCPTERINITIQESISYSTTKAVIGVLAELESLAPFIADHKLLLSVEIQ